MCFLCVDGCHAPMCLILLTPSPSPPLLHGGLVWRGAQRGSGNAATARNSIWKLRDVINRCKRPAVTEWVICGIEDAISSKKVGDRDVSVPSLRSGTSKSITYPLIQQLKLKNYLLLKTTAALGTLRRRSSGRLQQLGQLEARALRRNSLRQSSLATNIRLRQTRELCEHHALRYSEP